MATIREVSRRAGVSVATVSRVVNGNQRVLETTRQKVLEAMAALGYEPNSFARSLATNKSETIGMVVGELAGPFFGEMMQFAERVIRDEGRHLIITSGHASLAEERDAIEFLLRRRCDALILHLDLMSDAEILRRVDAEATPIILVNRLIPELVDQCIYLDNEAGGSLATRHLIEHGHTRIACITGPLYKSDARDRLTGYRTALKMADIPYDEQLVVEGDYLEQGGEVALERLFRRNTPFTGLVAGNDLMAIGVIKALRRNGLSVPEDCSVVGYDDVVMAGYIEPGLTTVRVPIEQFGAEAGRLALNLGEGHAFSVQHRFQPTLVERASTSRPAERSDNTGR